MRLILSAVVVIASVVIAPASRGLEPASVISATLVPKTGPSAPQGRAFAFDSTLTNSNTATVRVDIVLTLLSPTEATLPFLAYTESVPAGGTVTRTLWVSAARYFPERGSFTIRTTLNGEVLAALVYKVRRSDVVIPTFDDVTADAAVGSADGPGNSLCEAAEGAAWADVDGDTDLDLFVPSLEPLAEPHHLWINDGTGHFTNQAASRGIADAIPGMGAVFADYDNDGDPDLYRSNDGPNQLYRNDGSGHFVDVAAAAGVDDPGMSQSAAWGDYDRDGRLDLFSVNYADCVGGWPGTYQPDHLYHQLPDHTFEDVTTMLPATPVDGAGFQASFVDYDDDGDVDLYVVNDYIRSQPVVPDHNRLFRNDGADGDGWRFTDASDSSRAGYAMNAMGTAIGDPDRDLDLDFVVSNVGGDKYARNNGNGTFSAREKQAKVAAPEGSLPSGDVEETRLFTWGEVFADLNNDGAEDLYTGASVIDAFNRDPRPNRLLVNGHDGTFLDLSAATGADDWSATRAVVVADYDRDGRLDLLSVNKKTAPVLYRNTTTAAGNWLEVDTIGTRSNRDGCGATAILVTASGAQRRDVFCGSTSLGSGMDSTLHFGLGTDTAVVALTITWPSGEVQSVAVGPINRLIEVTEPGSQNRRPHANPRHSVGPSAYL